MIKNKAYTSITRLEFAVSKIWEEKRKGTHFYNIDDLLESHWIPKDSQIALALKDYAFTYKYDSVNQLSSLVSRILDETSTHTVHRYDSLDEIPSNGFELPSEAGYVLNGEIWYPQVDYKLDEVTIGHGIVIGIRLQPNGLYKLLVDTNNQDIWEGRVFTRKSDLKIAIENHFID